MHMRPGMLLLSGVVGALALLGESTTMAQSQPSGGDAPSPPTSGAHPGSPPPAADIPPPAADVLPPATDIPPPPAPGYGYPPAPGYGYPPAPGYGYPPGPGYPPPTPGYGYPAPGYALPPPEREPAPVADSARPGYHKHDGFFLRLHGGFGYLTAKQNDQGSTRTTSGAALALSAAFGMAVASNLIFYGEFLGTWVPDPSRSYGGNSLDTSGMTMSVLALGPGMTYYLESINMYLSGTAVLSHFSVDQDNDGNSTNIEKATGFGLRAVAGKEWWVSTNWGLGAAVRFQWDSMKDSSADAWTKAWGLALLFSSTYN